MALAQNVSSTSTSTDTGTDALGGGGPSVPDLDQDQSRAEATRRCFEQIAASRDAHECEMLRDQVVVLNIGVADSLASRYRGRGIPVEDLTQVARLGLVRAARGFDAEASNDFLAYAVPTIRGELKKHFRDCGWTVRPPRRIQEAQAKISAAAAELSQTLGRSPRPSEVAEHLDLDEDTVIEALATDGCFTPSSLDQPARRDDTTSTVGERLGGDDPDFARVEARVVLGRLVAGLPERDRLVVELRFVEGLTQQQIGERIGVTQMQVSRILSRILRDLREQIGPLAA